MISRKEFERQYSTELLPSSMANYSIGDIWDWKGFIFNRNLAPENANVAELQGDEELLKKLQSIALYDANLPDIDMTDDFKADSSLSIPSLHLNLKGSLDKDVVEGFHFSSIQGKNAIGFNSLISSVIENLKKANFEKYDKKVRNFEVVTGLFYAGSVNIVVKKEISTLAEIEAKLKAIPDTKINIDAADSKTIKYTISNSKCPFAAQFKTGRDI